MTLLVIGGVHPNPGPTNIKTVYNHVSPDLSPRSFTLPFTNPAPDLPASVPNLMGLNLTASSSNSISSHPSSTPDLTVSSSNPASSHPSSTPDLTVSSSNLVTSQPLPIPDLMSLNLSSSPGNSSSCQPISQPASQPVTSQPALIPSQPASTPTQSAPAPSQPTIPASHTFLQFNVNGVKNSLTELNSFLHDHKIKIVCLQETRLSSKSKNPSFLDYTLLRKERPVGNEGGVAILIHHSVTFSPIDVSSITQGDDVVELLGISASVNGSPINVFCLYVPPASSCPQAYKFDLNPLLNFSDTDTIIMGDVNAHHPAWFASSTCGRGDDLVESIENSAMCVLNTDTPTRLPGHGNPNSPDITLISAHLLLSSSRTPRLA